MTTTKPKWWEGRMVAVDTETTGINPHHDRIVTAAIVQHRPGDRPWSTQWIINPGVDVPAEAAAVHGWTNSRLADYLPRVQAARLQKGRTTFISREGALHEIAVQLASVIHTDTPLIAANAAFDLTLIEAELARHGIDTLASRPSGIRGVVDPMIVDKQWDPYRKGCYKAPGCDRDADPPVHACGGCRGGKHACGGCGATDKTLTSLCAHYGVRLTGAHDAAADALGALRVTQRLAGLWPQIARLRLPTLHQHQVTWRRDQMNGLRGYFDKNQIEHDGCCGEWPLHAACAPKEMAA